MANKLILLTSPHLLQPKKLVVENNVIGCDDVCGQGTTTKYWRDNF